MKTIDVVDAINKIETLIDHLKYYNKKMPDQQITSVIDEAEDWVKELNTQ